MLNYWTTTVSVCGTLETRKERVTLNVPQNIMAIATMMTEKMVRETLIFSHSQSMRSTRATTRAASRVGIGIKFNFTLNWLNWCFNGETVAENGDI